MFMEWMRESSDLLDLMLIFVVVYTVLKSLLDTRVEPMSPPIVAEMAAFALLSGLMLRRNVSRIEDVLRGVVIYLPILTIALFQPKLRRAFFAFRNSLRLRRRAKLGEDGYDEIVLAATTLAYSKTGALIVIERGEVLREVINRGVSLDAEVSYDLLVSIFNPESPLHDGAVIVSGHRVAAARCFSRITLNPRISKYLGTRHRAAIGISEDTDAVVVVVSEETGLISFTQAGKIRRGLDAPKLRAAMLKAFKPPWHLTALARFHEVEVDEVYEVDPEVSD
jgi:diadenylate cyclase